MGKKSKRKEEDGVDKISSTSSQPDETCIVIQGMPISYNMAMIVIGTIVFVTLILTIGTAVGSGRRNSPCNAIESSSALVDALQEQICDQQSCQFDVSRCDLNCPFGYATGDNDCPDSCLCAADGNNFQGDIRFAEDEISNMLLQFGYTKNLSDQFSVFSSRTSAVYVRQWDRAFTNGRHKVPVVLDDDFNMPYKKAIKMAHFWLTEKTCIDFVPRTTERAFMKYTLAFKTCRSLIGVQTKYYGEGQPIELDQRRCLPAGTPAHETMHALGFHHEHCRPDRDDYVQVLMGNVDPRASVNFKKLASGQTAGGIETDYDIGSVMHYGGQYFSTNGQSTIRRLDTGEEVVPQRFEVTDLDAEGINKFYKCPAKKQRTTTTTARATTTTTTTKATTTTTSSTTTTTKAITTTKRSTTTATTPTTTTEKITTMLSTTSSHTDTTTKPVAFSSLATTTSPLPSVILTKPSREDFLPTSVMSSLVQTRPSFPSEETVPQKTLPKIISLGKRKSNVPKPKPRKPPPRTLNQRRGAIQWGAWGFFRGCVTGTEVCWLGGVGMRRRTCRYGTLQECTAKFPKGPFSVQVRQCDLIPCIHAWEPWGPWQPCSRTCGGGSSLRFREPQNSICSLANSEAQNCNIEPCVGEPTWTSWLLKDECSRTCGEDGIEILRRFCVMPNGDHVAEGSNCPGVHLRSNKCPKRPCELEQMDELYDEILEARMLLFDEESIETRIDLCNTSAVSLWVLGDFNGDNIADISCEEFGDFKVAISSTSNVLNYVHWRGEIPECKSDLLTAADFNGDGSDDLLCHDVFSGFLTITLSSNGTFPYQPSYTSQFCTSYGDEIIILDWDGDGRMDIMCGPTDDSNYEIRSPFPPVG